MCSALCSVRTAVLSNVLLTLCSVQWAVHCVQLLESGARLLPAAAAPRARWHVDVRLTVSRHRRHGWQEEPGKEDGTGFLLSLSL